MSKSVQSASKTQKRTRAACASLAAALVVGGGLTFPAQAGGLLGEFPTSILDAFENVVGSDINMQTPAWQPSGVDPRQQQAAQSAESQYYGIDVAAFDIAGYQLYMQPQAVQGKIEQDKYTILARRSDEDSKQLRELNVRLSDANILAQRDGVAVPRESLDIDFGVDDRNVTRRLTLNFNYDDVKERDQLLTAATNKFGAPNARFSETEMAWGFWQVDESGAPSQTLDTGRPNLRLSSVDGTLTLTLIDPRF